MTELPILALMGSAVSIPTKSLHWNRLVHHRDGFLASSKILRLPKFNFGLLQWRLESFHGGIKILFGSRVKIHRYKGELAAIVWALEKTRIFTLGARQLIVVTDHKPLINI